MVSRVNFKGLYGRIRLEARVCMAGFVLGGPCKYGAVDMQSGGDHTFEGTIDSVTEPPYCTKS